MDNSLNEQPQQRQTVGVAAAQAPDGSWWISVTHQTGSLSLTYGIPLDIADETADQLSSLIKECAAEGRRRRSGLILASDQAPTGPLLNGSQARRRRR